MSTDTQQFVLKAMAKNYASGHRWDHLDSEACQKASEEIGTLRANNERLTAELAAAKAQTRFVMPDLSVLKKWIAEQGDQFDSYNACIAGEVWGLCKKEVVRLNGVQNNE